MDSRSLIFALLAACAGPDPVVQHAIATPSPLPGATRVSMDIVNRAGHGEVSVKIELRGARGQVIRSEKTVEIEGKQTLHYETDIETPPGLYAVKASAEYPD
ncbi:MAG TPA: hypothetical protein VL326_19055 [Kofleriaceae bacterium]|jgi:hypothetical protein|nr:hypothetical protein [Kofleriaceae bacterium]